MGAIEANAELIFGLLGQEPRSFGTLRLLGRQWRKRGTSGAAAVAGELLPAMRGWLEREFRSDLVRALIAPWILHVGLGPESSLSATMAKLILFTLEAVGNPFVAGGSDRIVDAFRRVIEQHGGRIETGVDIARIVTANGVATGVEAVDGRRWQARRAVVCNATPAQLYGRLLDAGALPEDIAGRAERYAYGRADMQIHIALNAPPRWSADPMLAEVALVHLTAGLDGVSRAVNEAERGLLPAEGTIVVGQPCATDPSRCPPGASMLWIQLQELPRSIRGDAAGAIEPPADGRWGPAVAQAYADRILARLRRHIVNLDDATVGMTILSPADLEAANINLVGGDPYSGNCAIEQFHLFRPFPGGRNHRTPIKRLWHIGASTHPGPGLGGMSGHLVAQEIR
jgi:phytoene dehydrogenase-like protein